MPPANEAIVEDIHELDKRTSIVETKTESLEEKIDTTIGKVDHLTRCVNNIEVHIAKQNGALPRIEDSLKIALAKIDVQENKGIESNTKTKVLWAGASFFLTSVGALILKMLFGGG